MTKKEYCRTHPTIAYYSGFSGFEIHGIEYGKNDYIIVEVGAWCATKSYHKLKIYYDSKEGPYVRFHRYRIPFNECIRTVS